MVTDENGRATFGRWKRRVDENGTVSQRGNTREINQQILDHWKLLIDQRAAWTKHGPENKPHSMVRSGYDALLCYIDAFINNKMCQGYSVYHSTSVDGEDIDVCEADDDYLIDLGIKVGERYFHFDKKLVVCLTGDGASGVKNTPHNVYTLALAFLKVFMFDYELIQSRHAGICVLLSSLGDKDDRVVNYVQGIFDSLRNVNLVKVKSVQHDAWFVFDLDKFMTGDWDWQCRMHMMSINSNGIYSLIHKCVWNRHDCDWEGVAKNNFFQALIGIHIQPYQTVKISQAQTRGDEFYSLTTNDIAKNWATKLESSIAAKKRQTMQRYGNLDKWTEKYEKEQRKKTSKAQKHGIQKYV